MLENIMTSLANIKNKREALLVLILFVVLLHTIQLMKIVSLKEQEIKDKQNTIFEQDRNIDGLITSYATILRNQQEIPLYERLEPMLNSKFPNISTIIQDLRENKQNENNFKQLSANLNNYFNEFEYLRDSINRAESRILTEKNRRLIAENRRLQEIISDLEDELILAQRENESLIQKLIATTKHYTNRLFKEKQIVVDSPPNLPLPTTEKPIQTRPTASPKTKLSALSQVLVQDKIKPKIQYYRFGKPASKKTKTPKIVIDEISQSLEKAIFESIKDKSVLVKVKIYKNENLVSLKTGSLSKDGLEMDISELNSGEYEAKILYGTHSIIKDNIFKFSL